MEIVWLITKFFNIEKTGVKAFLLEITALLITIDMLYVSKHYKGIGLDDTGFRYSIAQIICHCSMLLIICLWIYAAPKFKKGHDHLENYLYEITGVDINRKLGEGTEEARLLWKSQKACSCVFVFRGCGSYLIIIFKILYIILWLFMTCMSCRFLPFIKLKHIQDDYLGIMTILLAFISMLLCMFSWWGCMEYGYFISRVSKLQSIHVKRGQTVLVDQKNQKEQKGQKEQKQIVNNPYIKTNCPDAPDIDQYYFNPVRPSQTHALTRLMFDSSMTSVVFLIVSGLYSIQYMAAMLLERADVDVNNPWEWMWMIMVLLPGLVSLLPVVVWPKLFILRIHRQWKRQLIKDYQRKLHTYFYKTQCGKTDEKSVREERNYWLTMIDTVYKDRMGIKNFEIVVSILSVALNIGIIIATAANH